MAKAASERQSLLSKASKHENRVDSHSPWVAWWRRLLFAQANRVMSVGNVRALDQDDLVEIDSFHKAAQVGMRFKRHYLQSQRSVYRALWRMFRVDVIACAVGNLWTEGSAVFAPIVLRHVVESLTSSNVELKDLWIWLGCFFVSRLLTAIVSCQTIARSKMVARSICVAFQTLLFEKAMRLSTSQSKKSMVHVSNNGSASSNECLKEYEAKEEEDDEDEELELMNLISCDVDTIQWLAYDINDVWLVPVQVGALMYLLYDVLGFAAFAGVGVILLSGTLGVCVSKGTSAAYDRLMQKRDARMRAVRETVDAIQLIKLNGWEYKFVDQVLQHREEELHALQRSICWKAVNTCIFWSTPLFVSMVSFAVYTFGFGHSLTPAVVFTSIALFNSLRDPLEAVPSVLSTIMESKVSLDRLAKYLGKPEKNDSCTSNCVDQNASFCDTSLLVSMENCSLGWNCSSPTIFCPSLKIHRGDFCMVYGGVGSGKSSLCAALLGEMKVLGGEMCRKPGVKIAYCAQQPWIQHMSIRDNIVFGQAFEEEKYKQVVDACGLTRDLDVLENGDLTEIGERGVNLSGGQKARVSLARACYFADEADIIVLDDPLAAIDAVVRQHIVQKCFGGLLKGKTIVLVTHQPEEIALRYANHLIHIDQGGVITFSRRHQRLDELYVLDEQRVDRSRGRDDRSPSSDNGKSTLVGEESREEGRVCPTVYWEYISSLGGLHIVGLLVFVQILWQALQISSDLWLSRWTTTAPERSSLPINMSVYAVLALLCSAMVLVRAVLVSWIGLQASRHLFSSMIKAVCYAPMRFFDTTPIGRVINRFSGDIDTLDATIPSSISNFLGHLAFMLCQLATAVYMVKVMGVLVVPLVILYARLGAQYLNPYREISRLEKLASSPVFSYLSQAQAGVVTLRSFGEAFVARASIEQFNRMDTCTRAVWNEALVSQWFGVRVKLLGSLMIIILVTALVYLRNVLSPGIIALAFTYILNVDSALAYTVRYWAWLEVEMVSAERVLEYTKITSEHTLNATAPSPTWPRHGTIEFRDVVFAYGGPHAVPVLNSITFTINAREKIGVVGRTGAGKSSLVMALFRMNELVSGSISIDGMDISRLPLSALRTRLSIIPQSPVLFRGTLRSFMDPLMVHDDASIWRALGKVGFADCLTLVGLDDEIAEQGGNYSLGERQLLCMARALLRGSTIVVFDEATASIDCATEAFLAAMLQKELVNATVITIAHRLSTIREADRIMVLDGGHVVEFDAPAVLHAKQSPPGMFYQLAQEAGLVL